MVASKYPVLVSSWEPLPRPSRGTWRKEWLGDVELAVTENTTMAERWPEYEAVEPIQAHKDIVAWPGAEGVDSAEAAMAEDHRLLGAEQEFSRSNIQEPPHEHEWVLGRRESKRLWIKVTKPLWLRCTWLCECGEGKVVEYEV